MNRILRLIMAALSAGLLALAIAACGGDEGGGGGAAEETEATASVEPIEEDPANKDTSITIGSKNFTEQYVLGNIYAQALEAAGFDVDTELNLGAEQVAYRDLLAGEVDAYPEYTGTALTSFFGYKTDDVPRDPNEAYELAKEEYAKEGITAPPQAPFDNTYVVTSTTETAEKLGNPTTITELSELQEAPDLSIAGFPECRQRTDCLLGLEEVYGWTPEFVSSEAQYEAIESGQSDFVFGFGTDGALSTDKYYTYEDDKNLFPPYHITLSMRDETAEEIGPEGIEVIERVQEPLTEEVMRELNARVDLDKQKEEAVATQYLEEAGFIE